MRVKLRVVVQTQVAARSETVSACGGSPILAKPRGQRLEQLAGEKGMGVRDGDTVGAVRSFRLARLEFVESSPAALQFRQTWPKRKGEVRAGDVLVAVHRRSQGGKHGLRAG